MAVVSAGSELESSDQGGGGSLSDLSKDLVAYETLDDGWLQCDT